MNLISMYERFIPFFFSFHFLRYFVQCYHILALNMIPHFYTSHSNSFDPPPEIGKISPKQCVSITVQCVFFFQIYFLSLLRSKECFISFYFAPILNSRKSHQPLYPLKHWVNPHHEKLSSGSAFIYIYFPILLQPYSSQLDSGQILVGEHRV